MLKKNYFCLIISLFACTSRQVHASQKNKQPSIVKYPLGLDVGKYYLSKYIPVKPLQTIISDYLGESLHHYPKPDVGVYPDISTEMLKEEQESAISEFVTPIKPLQKIIADYIGREEIRYLKKFNLQVAKQPIQALALSPDNRYLAYGFGNIVTTLDLRTNKVVGAAQLTSGIATGISYVLDDFIAVGTSTGELYLYSYYLSEKVKIYQATAHKGTVRLGISHITPNGSRGLLALLTNGNLIQIACPRSETPLAAELHEPLDVVTTIHPLQSIIVGHLEFPQCQHKEVAVGLKTCTGAKSSNIIACAKNQFTLAVLVNNMFFEMLDKNIHSIALSNNDLATATTDGIIRLRDLSSLIYADSGAPIIPHAKINTHESIKQIEYLPDGNLIFSSPNSNALSIYSSDGAFKQQLETAAPVTSFVVTQQGKLIVASHDGALTFFEPTTPLTKTAQIEEI